MHLSTLYARDLGVHPSKPIIVEHFFPLPCSKYITFHNSEKVQSKSYSYWTEVLEIIKPYLNTLNIKVTKIITSLEDPTTPPPKDYLKFLREPIIRLKRFPQQDFLRPLDEPFPFPQIP